MRKKTKKEQEKLTELLKTPKMSDTKQRKVKRRMKSLRRFLRRRQETERSRDGAWFDEQIERARIIREVEAGET